MYCNVYLIGNEPIRVGCMGDYIQDPFIDYGEGYDVIEVIIDD